MMARFIFVHNYSQLLYYKLLTLNVLNTYSGVAKFRCSFLLVLRMRNVITLSCFIKLAWERAGVQV